MKWEECKLQKRTGQVKDVLGNMVGGGWETVAECKARITPWTDEQIAVEGREVTCNEQRYALQLPVCRYPKEATHAVVDGIRLEISKSIDLTPRYTAIQVKVYRSGLNGCNNQTQ